jgi:protease-4
MKLSRVSIPPLSREVRIAVLTAVLIAAGAICFGAGWRASAIALFAAAAGVVAAFQLFVVRPAKIPRDAALSIRIAGGIREDAPRSPLDQLRSRGMPTLYQLRLALEAAAADPGLKTVVVELADAGAGLATAQELHDLLRAIAAAGKRVVAVLSGDSVSVRDYLIACGANEIIINPDSAMMMLGVSAGSFFLRNALAKIGVEAQTLQWKEYKGAAETFSREAMSPELRESLEAIIADWRTVLAENVAAARKLGVERARELLGGGFMSVRSACAAGLADRAGYIEDIRAEIEPDGKRAKFVTMRRYLRHAARMRDGRGRPRLALIHGLGPVLAGEGPAAGEFLSGERVAENIRRAAKDDSVRAIVFRVNSPGGSAVGSDLVWRAVGEARRLGKPVVVSMGDVAGSGGYYVAMNADAIVAEPSTITGSIGVVYTKFSMPELLRQLGVGIDVAKSDAISDALSVARPLTGAELAQLNQVVGELYDTFTAKLAAGRGLDPAAAEQSARGRVWSGIAAKERGLVDELGGLARAVAIARDKAGLKPGEAHDLAPYPPASLLSGLSGTLGRSEMPLGIELAAAAFGMPSRWAPAMLRLAMRGGLALMCPVLGTHDSR